MIDCGPQVTMARPKRKPTCHTSRPYYARGLCKQCYCKSWRETNTAHTKAYREANHERILSDAKAYYEANREQINQHHREYYQQNREQIKQRHHEYYQRNREQISQHRREYSQRNREQIKQHHREYRQINREQINEASWRPRRRLALRLRNRLNDALRGQFKSGSAVRDLGCSIPEFEEYLEARFAPGMNWNNWGVHGWHLDHIIPLASFNLTDRKQFLAACHYTNLQPLWAEDNLHKHASMPRNKKQDQERYIAGARPRGIP